MSATNTTPGLETFLREYIRAALWTGIDEETNDPLEYRYSSADIAPETLAKMREDCEKFLSENAERLSCETYTGAYDWLTSAAHDFWLTRNGHGSGFWDGDWTNGDELTEVCRAYPEQDLYTGDDGKLYLA